MSKFFPPFPNNGHSHGVTDCEVFVNAQDS